MRTQFALLFLLSTAVRLGAGTQCYACSSARDPSCAMPDKTRIRGSECSNANTPPATTYLNDVAPGIENIFNVWPPTGTAQCLKLNITTSGRPTVMIRTCTNLGASTCAQLSGAVGQVGGALDNCMICDGDLCNTAPQVVLAAPLLAAVIAILVVR